MVARVVAVINWYDPDSHLYSELLTGRTRSILLFQSVLPLSIVIDQLPRVQIVSEFVPYTRGSKTLQFDSEWRHYTPEFLSQHLIAHQRDTSNQSSQTSSATVNPEYNIVTQCHLRVQVEVPRQCDQTQRLQTFILYNQVMRLLLLTTFFTLISHTFCLDPPNLTTDDEGQCAPPQPSQMSVQHNIETPDASKPTYKFRYYIFEETCYDSFFVKREFLNFPCIQLTLSKFLGYALVYGSLLVKAPQIIKIFLNCSVLGISFSSVIIQSLMNALMIGYNIQRDNPFSIYGENVFLGLSNLAITLSFLLFSKSNKLYHLKGIIILMLISGPLILQIAPSVVIQNSLWLGIVAFMVSRLEQVRQNHRNKSTGHLSLLTSFMNFGGNVARSFTILVQARGDILYLLSNVFPIFINGYILLQFWLYWNNRIQKYEAICIGDFRPEQTMNSQNKGVGLQAISPH